MGKKVIIIGSGISGLTAGIVLAREGYDVLVLEKHTIPGGLLQVYRRGGSVFPVGVHCLGALDEGQIMWRYLKCLGVLDRIRLIPMEQDGFAKFCFPDMEVDLPYGYERCRQSLIERFGSEQRAIDRYLSDMKQTVLKFPLYNLSTSVEGHNLNGERRSLGSYLDSLTDSDSLKQVLKAISPLYGIPSNECPLSVHFLVTDSFMQSSWRLDTNFSTLSDAFVAELKELGGQVRCRSHVTGIECEDRVVNAVRLADGESISADIVIFTGHPKQLPTIGPRNVFRKAFNRRILDTPETAGIFGLGIEWKGQSCPMALHDTLLYQVSDVDSIYHQTLIDNDCDPAVIYCSSSPEPINGAYSAMAMVATQCEEWQPWWDSTTGKRQDEYYRVKEAIAERIMNVLRARWPEHAQRLKVVDSFTPLTLRDYTGNVSGSAYGLKRLADSPYNGVVRPLTRAKNLLLAGQSVVLSGVLGAMISGISVCTILLGSEYLIERIRSETE